jgi:dGTPase
LRVVTELERRYPGFDGLNLSWETLEGIVKHNGPLATTSGDPAGRYREQGLPEEIRRYNAMQDLELWSHASAEAQAAAIADDIAYDAHDIDDGLRAGLFALEDIATVPLVGRFVADIRAQYPGLEDERLVHELVRRLIGAMIMDVIAESGRRLHVLGAQSVEEIRSAERPVVGFSAAMAEGDKAIKNFLYPRMYRHERVDRVMTEAEGVVRDLFEHYRTTPEDLPVEWRSDGDEHAHARGIADFIAGMTDRYALVEHARFFKQTPELR